MYRTGNSIACYEFVCLGGTGMGSIFLCLFYVLTTLFLLLFRFTVQEALKHPWINGIDYAPTNSVVTFKGTVAGKLMYFVYE